MVVGMTNIQNELIHEESVAAMSPKKTKNDTIENNTPAELEVAASEWTADPIVTSHQDESLVESLGESEVEPLGAEVVNEAAPSSVMFMSEPMNSGPNAGMSSALEIAAAQNSDEPLDLDSDLDLDADLDADTDLESEDAFALDEALNLNEAEVEDTLARLQEKMDLETAESARVAEEFVVIQEEDAKKLLAAQIAEDEALERAMAEEAEDENDPELLRALPREPEEDEHGNLDLSEMESCIEALLFMSEKPMSATKLREFLGPEMSLHYFQEALTNLKTRYQRFQHGFELVEIANGYQFRTKAVRAPLAKRLAKIQTQRLSTGAMESLAIIAYKQPVLKDDIDKIRGVDSSHFIRGLLDKKLIKIAGRSELPGRPMLYTTSPEFLEVFSLKSLDALPPLKELESMIPGSESGNPENADPRVKKMRELVSEMNDDQSVSLLYNPREDEEFLSEIRERVKGISVTTPTLQAQADEADAAKASEKHRLKAIAEGTLDPQAESFAAAVNEADTGSTAELPLDQFPRV